MQSSTGTKSILPYLTVLFKMNEKTPITGMVILSKHTKKKTKKEKEKEKFKVTSTK